MGSNNLAARSDGQTVQADDVNQYRNALIGDQVPRNASGAPEPNTGSLGTSGLPWQNLYITGQIIQNDSVVDLSSLAGESHQIISGTSLASGYPDFLTFEAATTTGRILGNPTSLVLIVNNSTVSLSSNIDVTGLTTAPTSNHTCAINDAGLTGQPNSRLLGEDGAFLSVDTVGSEISSLDGTVQVFQKGSEFLFALIDTANNKLWPFKRGIAKTDREVLNNNDVLTLRQGNYIFIDADGVSTYKTTIFPTAFPTEPDSPSSNQWNFNGTDKRWQRYAGSWSNMNAHWLGTVICNGSAAVAADANDFSKKWGAELEGSMQIVDGDTLRVILSRINVAGRNFYLNQYGQTIKLSVSGDRESGVTEVANADYYIYCDQNLKLRFSNVPPRYKDYRLGLYHPKQYWRYLGTVRNNSASDFGLLNFDGNDRTATQLATPYPTGYSNSAAPVWASNSTFTIARIRERDTADTANITKETDTTVNFSNAGLNGIARSLADLSGTITYTNGSATVGGSGTSFEADYQAGDTIWDSANSVAVGIVSTVNSNVSITLTSSFSGTTEAGATHRRGAKVNGSWWFVYAISDGVTTGILLSTRNTMAGHTLVDLPSSGYTLVRPLRFLVKINSSGNITKFRVGYGWPYRPFIYFDTPMSGTGSSPTTQVLSGGSQTSFTAFSVASYVPISVAKDVMLYCNRASGNDVLTLRPTGETHNGLEIGLVDDTGGNDGGLATPLLKVGTSGQLDYKVGSGSWSIDVYGFVVTEIP